MYTVVSELRSPELADNNTGAATDAVTTYEFHIFLPRCETYAIRIANSAVTGVYGPLEYDEVLFKALPTFPYDTQPEGVEWVKSNLSDFVPCEMEYEENTLWI